MKHFLFISILIFTSCTINKSEKTIESVKNTIPWEKVIKFEYEGHSYIKFYIGDCEYSSTAGVVHDPECKRCFEVFE